MKRFFLLLLCSTSLLSAEENYENYSYWDFHPIHAGGNVLRMGRANMSSPDTGHLFFRKSNAFLYMLVPISRDTYFFPRVEFNAFTMDWNKNPKFHETNFYYTQYALTFYSTALENWRWIARADYNLDVEHYSRPRQYGLFSALLWGAHQVYEGWHYHIGALGYTGMDGDQIYPVIGGDYAPNEKWLIQAIFPINYSIEYNLTKEWRFALKAKPFKERFRTGVKEPQPRSIFNYSSTGAEFNVHYERLLRLEVEAYVGYNFGGSFYIKDAHGQNALYTSFEGAPYFGGSLNFGF